MYSLHQSLLKYSYLFHSEKPTKKKICTENVLHAPCSLHELTWLALFVSLPCDRLFPPFKKVKNWPKHIKIIFASQGWSLCTTMKWSCFLFFFYSFYPPPKEAYGPLST